MESAITTRGRVTIPKPIRDHLGLKPGDRVKFFLHPAGTVVLLPKVPIAALRGMVRRSGTPISLEGMGEAIAAGMTARSVGSHGRAIRNRR